MLVQYPNTPNVKWSPFVYTSKKVIWRKMGEETECQPRPEYASVNNSADLLVATSNRAKAANSKKEPNNPPRVTILAELVYCESDLVMCDLGASEVVQVYKDR